METQYIGTRKVIFINTIIIIVSTIFAIIVHALLPAAVDDTKLDSIFVKWFGFAVVAIFYFIVLFTQCAVAVGYIGKRTNIPKLQVGIRFGIAFAMIYLIGMQEVVVSASPFATWGLDFVKYQFIMGIGDGIPAIFLCLAIAYFTLSNNKGNQIQKLDITKSIKVILIVVVAIFIERIIFYKSGLITSDISLYPIPCYVWTGFFGLALGYIYVLLYPLLVSGKKTLRFISIIGVNWIIFNCFIGLISKGAMPQALFRSGADVAILFISTLLIDRYVINGELPTKHYK